MRSNLLTYGTVGVLAATTLACGMNPQKHYENMRANMLKHNYDAVADYLEKSKEKIYSKDNRLLYYMDKGMVLSLGKRYQESNTVLEQAKQAAEELWTESIGANAMAWVTTDNSLPYQGEDFEKVMLHFVAALNFIGMGEYSGARVEARQVTSKLELYNSKYEEGPNVYKDDAFARWLSGKLGETEGNYEGLNSAWIDYKKALEVYQTDYAERYGTAAPDLVVADALRVLEALGPDFKAEYDQVRARFPNVQYVKPADAKNMGEIVFVHMNGEAPYKMDRYWEAQAGDDQIRIAYPEFVAKPKRIVSARIRAGDQMAMTELAQNVTAIAIQNLNDHMGRIQAKAIARAVAKYIAAKATQAAGNAVGDRNAGLGAALWLAGAVYQVGSNIAEEADKRSWITLPSEIWVGRTFVQPGQATINVEFLDGAGNVVETTQLNADVQPGEIKFVSYRTYN